MKIVKILILFFGISVTHVRGKPVGNYRTVLLSDDTIGVTRIAKKRNEDSSRGYYLEQCGVVKFPNAKRGVVNVLAFLDSSWPYSHRQLIMLKMLNDRLRRSGLLDTLFFVVNVDPYFSRKIDEMEDDIEREAWLGVSPEEIESFSETDKTFDSLAKSINSDINLIQDNENLGIWKELRGSRDQVLVIDRCGKLTYQVIVPWSILHFPYVKAAILSTYKDEPCGPCDIFNDTADGVEHNDDLGFSFGTTSSIKNNNDIVTTSSDIITEIDPRVEENFQGSFDIAENKTTVKLSNTSEATSKSNLFHNFDNTTVVATARNLIVEDGSPTIECSTKRYEESTTPMTFTDFSSEENYLREIGDDATTMSSTFSNGDYAVESDPKISDNTNDYRGININAIKALVHTSMEENFEQQTVIDLELEEKSIDLKSKANLPDQEEKHLVTAIFNTTNTIIETTTQENLYSQTEAVLGLEEKSVDLKDQANLPDQEDKYFTTGIFNTTDTVIEMTTQENLYSQTEAVLGLEEQSVDLKDEANLPDQEDKYVTTRIFNTTDTIIETSTQENLNSQTEAVLGLEEESVDLKDQANLPDQEDKYVTPGIFNTTDTVIETTTQELLYLQTAAVEEKSIVMKNKEQFSDQEDNNDKSIIISNSPYTSIETTTQENLYPQTVEMIGIEGIYFDLKNDKSLLDQENTNETTYSNIFEFQTTDSSIKHKYTTINPSTSLIETTPDIIFDSKTEYTFIDSIVTHPTNLDIADNNIDITRYIGIEATSELPTTNAFQLTASKKEDDLLDSDRDLIHFYAKDSDPATTTLGVIFDFATSRSFHLEGTSANSKMADATLDSGRDSIKLNAESSDFSTADNEPVTSSSRIVSTIDTTAKEIFTLNTPEAFAIKEESLKNNDPQINQQVPNENDKNEDHMISSYMPIRIIMHAPHFHADGDSTRMHEYLVLKTGNSQHHGHLASNDATRLYRGPQDYQEKIADLTSQEIENKEWPMKNLIYNKDESTGLYGEIADYWRDLESLEIYEDAEETERPDDEKINKVAAVDANIWKQHDGDERVSGETVEFSKESKGTVKTTDTYRVDTMSEMVTDMQSTRGPEEFNAENEETRSQLIAHYSKLLPWIYYVLDK